MILLQSYEIDNIVDSVARKLEDREYDYPQIVAVVVMNGAFMFAADLVRRLDLPIQVDFIHVRRGYSIGAPGRPVLTTPYTFQEKKTYILLDVIAERGETFEYLKTLIPKKAQTVTCSLIAKGSLYTPTILGERLNTPDHLQGYGMGPQRELPWIESVRR